MRLQNPSPNARLTARGEAPFPSAARATTTTAIATNTKASGNQRSAHVVKPIAMRTNMPSCLVALLRGNAALVAVMADSSLVFIFEQTKRESCDAAGVSAIGNLCDGTCRAT